VIDVASEGMFKARAALERKLRKAGKAVIAAQAGLEAAMAVYSKTHDAGVKQGRLVPTVLHKKLVGGITKAREKLTRRLLELQGVEDEHKEYFRPI